MLKVSFALLFTLTIVTIAPALSQVLVPQSALTATSITVTVKGKSSEREIFCLKKIAGSAKKRSTGYSFTSFKILLRNLQRTDPTSPKLSLFKALAAAGSSACTNLQAPPPPEESPAPAPGATPVPPTATPSPTATPRPTSTPSTGNFDSQGNVTEKGKTAFGIPSNLSANVTVGKAVSASFCSGCHIERVGRSYQEIDSAIRKSPMLYDEASISRQQLADLVAYLNRFRPS